MLSAAGKRFIQPRTQASSRYPNCQRRHGTECNRVTFPTSLTGDVKSEIKRTTGNEAEIYLLDSVIQRLNNWGLGPVSRKSR